MRLAVPLCIWLGIASCQPSPVPSARAAPLYVDPPPVPLPTARADPAPPAPIARHVIIVSEDGLRPDALVRSGASFHRRLMGEGAYSPNALTIRNASTLPSHAAMLSGFDVHDHGVSWNSWQPARGFIKVPTVLTAAVASGHGAAAFVGKKKLAHVIRPGVVDVFARPGYLCRKVVQAATEYFLEHRPLVEFVHFSDPDSLGHKSGWMSDAQLAAVRRSDECLRNLVQSVAASDMADETLIIVSSDHGGHGHNHSGRELEDRRIPWIAWGARVRQGHVISRPVSTMDTAATALWALGLAPPDGLTGKPVMEAFTETSR